MEQGGQLLMNRRRISLSPGITEIDTGITQSNLGVSPDPPVGGEDPSVGDPGVASRVMVIPCAPLSEWSGVLHGEPRLDAATGTVKVDFFLPDAAADVEINVCFWNPHTLIGPVSAEVYTELTCPEILEIGVQSNAQENALTVTVPNPTAAAGSVVVAFVSFTMDDQFADPVSDPTADDAGWTLLRRGEIDLGGNTGVKFVCYYRISAVSDPASYSFTANLPGVGNASGIASIAAYGSNYVPTDTPVVDAAAVVDETPETPLAISAPSQTVPAGQAPAMLLTYFIGVGDPNVSFWQGAVGMTEIAGNNAGGLAPDIVISLNEESIPTAGATGVRANEFVDSVNATGLAYSLIILPICSIFETGDGGIIDPG